MPSERAEVLTLSNQYYPGQQAISHNSCLTRRCPIKCQGAARQLWLAQRSAELLPVPTGTVNLSEETFGAVTHDVDLGGPVRRQNGKRGLFEMDPSGQTG